MSEATIRMCDYPTGRGRNREPHGVQVDEPTRLRIDGKEFVIDLCGEHREKMDDCLAPFIEIARRGGMVTAKNARGRAVMRARGGQTFTTADVREWLATQPGRTVAPSGRIPNADIEAYKVAHNLA